MNVWTTILSTRMRTAFVVVMAAAIVAPSALASEAKNELPFTRFVVKHASLVHVLAGEPKSMRLFTQP